MKQAVIFVAALLLISCGDTPPLAPFKPAPLPPDKSAPSTPLHAAQAMLNRSFMAYQNKDWQQCVDLATTAINMIPAGYAEAYLNRAAAEIMLGKYDAAINDAKSAVVLKPAVSLFRNNLKWALDMKARAR